MSDFLNVYIPHEGGEIEVEEFPTADAALDAMLSAKDEPRWRDIVQVYRHPGAGPLDNKWWAGGSTIYAREYERRSQALNAEKALGEPRA